MPARTTYSNGYVVDEFVSTKNEGNTGDSDAENLGEDTEVTNESASDADEDEEVDGEGEIDPASAVAEVKDLEMNVAFEPSSNGVAKLSSVEKLASSRVVKGIIGEETASEVSEGEISQFEPGSGEEDSEEEDDNASKTNGAATKAKHSSKGTITENEEMATVAGETATSARFKRNYDTLTNGHAPLKDAVVHAESDSDAGEEETSRPAKAPRLEPAEQVEAA